MSSASLALPAALLAGALVGCQVQRYQDRGAVCLGATGRVDTGGAFSVEAGEAVPVSVVFSTCSSGSTRWSNLGCSVESSGGQLRVEASARSRTPYAMTDDCRWIEEACGTVTLDEGEHVLAFGDEELAFEVPYLGPQLCVTSR